MLQNGQYPNGQRPRRAEEIQEEALRTQQISLVFQGLLMFAALGTFLVAVYKFSNDKKGS